MAWPSVMIMPNTGDNNDRGQEQGGKGSGEVGGKWRGGREKNVCKQNIYIKQILIRRLQSWSGLTLLCSIEQGPVFRGVSHLDQLGSS